MEWTLLWDIVWRAAAGLVASQFLKRMWGAATSRMRPIIESIKAIWEAANKMPPSKQAAPKNTTVQTRSSGVASTPLPMNGDILDGGVPVVEFGSGKITVALYGRNRVGKTTLACQGDGPTALISIEPSPTGGARSVSGQSDITVYQVATKCLGQERLRGSEKMIAIADALHSRFAAGQCPFRKVVIDGITSWNDVILSEVLGLTYEEMPAVLGLGKVSADQYIERGERLIRYLKPFFDLASSGYCDLWVIAQERDHNPPKDKTITKSGREFSRPSQTAFMRDAHPVAQEGSFFSLGVADTPAKWVQDASDFVMQLYEDNEWREEKSPDVVFNGQTVPGQVQLVPTGRRVKRLRCVYHPNYAAGFREDYRNVPEYIEANTPEDRYQAFLDVVAGRRTKWGYYSA